MDTTELKQACERAASVDFTAHVETNSEHFAEFNRLATPTVVLALIKEVEDRADIQACDKCGLCEDHHEPRKEQL